MSDLQLLTGLGILISGYSELRCYVSAYHWKLIVYLAWSSHVTHIACLTAMRSYLHRHKWERLWRLSLMGVTCVMLISAIVPTAFFNWEGEGLERSGARPASNAR